MKNICLYFKIHQPYRLKRYRFFDIGNDHYYYDDFANEEIITRIAQKSYIPTAKAILEMINTYGKDFKCTFSITGTAIEQLQMAVPEFIELLRKLASTGCVEFLSETYSHSLASLEDPEEFMRQVKTHDALIRELFGVEPKVFQNTELIFDDDIALMVKAMGFKGVLTEGAKHILGWKSPDYVYAAAPCPDLKLLLINDKMSEDISRNFNNTDWNEYPLTAEKYIGWIDELPDEEQVLNLFFNMETFGSFLPADTGIFDFLKALPRFAFEKGIAFRHPSYIVEHDKAMGELAIPFPLSGVDEARDVSAWRGNDLQREALGKLFSISERVNLAGDRRLKLDWDRLQSSDHFYYMNTKKFSHGSAFSPYDSPFTAFTNYMNVLADFLVRVEEQFPAEIDNEELNSLLLTIRNQESEINALKKEVKTLRNDVLEADEADGTARLNEPAVPETSRAMRAKAPAKTPARKKSR